MVIICPVENISHQNGGKALTVTVDSVAYCTYMGRPSGTIFSNINCKKFQRYRLPTSW